MSENAVGTGEAVAGTNPADPSTPAAPMLFGKRKPYHELRKLMIDKLKKQQGK